jgi:uncharacterized protein YndB with AHSA1/START domain
MSETIATSPVTKSIHVACDVDTAFRLFTTEIGTWWPTGKYAIHPGEVRKVVFEEREGGEVYEISDAGERAHWATVTAWDPPCRVALSWHVNPAAAAPTDVEVTFEREGDGTRVELVHSGWERLGEVGKDSRSNYDGGWDEVLGCFATSAA